MAKVLMWDRDIVDFVNTYSGDKALKKVLNNKLEKNVPLGVVYEDNHIIVVIKPQNIPTQEDESKDKDLLTMVKDYIKEKENKPGNVFVGLVHRLDRPTG